MALFDCDQLPECQALSTDDLLTALNLESDTFNRTSSDEYYMRKSFEEIVNITWARVESQRPRFSNWIRQKCVDGVETYCARTPFPCKPIKES